MPQAMRGEEIGRAPAVEHSRPAISARGLLQSGTPTAPGSVALPLLPSGPGGVRRFPLRGAQPSTPPRAAQFNARGPREGVQPRCSGLRVQGTATSPSSTAKPTTHVTRKWRWRRGWDSNPRHEVSPRARHFQCRTFVRSVTPPRSLTQRSQNGRAGYTTLRLFAMHPFERPSAPAARVPGRRHAKQFRSGGGGGI